MLNGAIVFQFKSLFARQMSLIVGVALMTASLSSHVQDKGGAAPQGAGTCPGDNEGITLPSGFCATIFADDIGHARHLVVAPNGVVYVNTRSDDNYGNHAMPPGGFRLGIVNARDLEQGFAARRELAKAYPEGSILRA